MRVETGKGRAAQAREDKGAVSVDGDAGIAAVKSDRISGAGIAAQPGVSTVGGGVNSLADEKWDECSDPAGF
jgi:hypothetical protein